MKKARRPITPRDLWAMLRVGSPAPSPDGSFVIVGATSHDVEANEGKERLYRLGTGEPRPLTAADVSSSQPAVAPDGRAVVFLRKPPPPTGEACRAPGWDRPQPYVLPLDGGEATRATSVLFPRGASDPRWFPDGRRLCVVAPVLSAEMTLEGTARLSEQRDKDPVKAHVTEDRVYRFWDQWLTDGAVPHLFEIVTHALHLYGVLKARGVEARLVYYPDENHWILKPRNSLHWYAEVQSWLARWLQSSGQLSAVSSQL